MKRDFEFDGSGFGYLWLCIWTTVLTVITCGLFFPWAYSAQQRWICSKTTITFGIYIPWGYCQFKRWETRNTVFADEY